MNPTTTPLFMVVWRCTRNCVGTCTYCSYIKDYAKDQELNTEQAKHMVDEIADFGSQWFGISGGEPLVRPDIWEIIEYAEKEHGLNVSLITSGYAWDEERFNKLTKYNVKTAISIDGTQPTNDKIRRQGGYDKAMHAMQKLSSVGLLDCLVTTMTKFNIQDLPHTAALAEQYHARSVVYHNLVPVGRAGEHMEDIAPTPEEYEKAFDQIYEIQRKLYGKVKVNVYSPFYARIVKQKNTSDFWDWFNEGYLGRCTIGGNYIGITENGDYRSCGFHEGYRVGNVKETKLRDAWNNLQQSEFHLRLRDKNNLKGRCGFCEYREICGGCRTRAEFYTGDLFASDPACNYIPKVLRENPKLLEEVQKAEKLALLKKQ